MNHQAIIVHLLREGEWSQAVLVYREETGAPRHLATREVKRIALQHNIALPISGWLNIGWFRSKQKSSRRTAFHSASGKS